MGKIKVGSFKQVTLVEGDINLLNDNEVLISQDEGYNIIRKKVGSEIETYVVIPLKELTALKTQNSVKLQLKESSKKKSRA